MARPDWNLSWFVHLPNMWNAESVSTSCRGSTRAIRTQGNTNHMGDAYVWTYNGNPYGDSNEGKFDDGSISIALRVGESGAGHIGMNGIMARCPWLLADGLNSNGYRQFYFLGNYNDHTEGHADEGDSLSCRLYRIDNATRTNLATVVFPVVHNNYVQFEVQFENSGGNVICRTRYNNSLAATGTGILSCPGSANWTSFNTICTDTSPGSLINPGYWGFGAHHVGSSGGGNIDEQRVHFDHITLYRGIP